MEQHNRKITLQTDVADASERIDNLILQFNEGVKDCKPPTSLLLHFYNSEEYSLLMGEVTRLFADCPLLDSGCNVEWESKSDNTLNEQMRIEITIN